MTTLRAWLVILGLWLARLGGWEPPRPAPVTDLVAPELVASARMFVAHVEEHFRGQSGEFKRAQVLRGLLNRHPGAKERDCALAIEVGVRSTW